MKTTRLIALIGTLAVIFFAASCDDSLPEDQGNQTILPERFGVDIPASLTAQSSSGRMVNGRVAEGDLDGNEIYQALAIFINIGEGASEIVRAIIGTIVIHGIDEPQSLSFESDDDGRVKNLDVFEDVTFDGVEYEFEMLITDAESEGNADGGRALQIFWNRNPIEGVAILKPYNINRNENPQPNDALFRIEYTENSTLDYDAHMIVTITGIPLADPAIDPYSIDNLKMFVGKKGEIVDVYGNSNHPNATFFNEQQVGFNWAFVASGIDNEDIAVAEVGLPPSNLDETSRSVLLEDYSIHAVFTTQIQAAFPSIDSTQLALYLHNTQAPGFFANEGFIQGGTSPGPEYDPLVERIQDLSPYNPVTISGLELAFQ